MADVDKTEKTEIINNPSAEPKKSNLGVIIAVVVVVILLILFVPRLFGGGGTETTPAPTETPVEDTVQ